ncbi:hypothetical protein [Oceanicoccus sp. KOV_DT_Chl]|uniref:hypothetical protein n=1 Tax=Oceanicoccus sp. KOV_DT_Chl TaxID=1904639 RepID=UPI000C7D53C1|nr:hypothetical protein [Oceanicoccus sp. KOV_DT_Chl]
MKLFKLLLMMFGLVVSQMASAQINMALLGDSIIDDYLGPSDFIGTNTNLAAGSFGQILAETRGSQINFGSYRAPTNNSADAWDSIRNFGYEYNWATAGATASPQDINLDFNGRLVSSQPGVIDPMEDYVSLPVASNLGVQVAGLTPSITAGDVDTVVISVGPNDFFYHTNVIDTVDGGLYPAYDGQIDEAFTNLVADSILSSIDELQAAGDVDIVLGLLATIPTMTQAEIDGVGVVNARLLTEAAAKGVVVLDLIEWTVSGENVDPITGDVTIGNVVVEYGSVADRNTDLGVEGDGVFCNFEGECPLDSHATKYLSEDGMHLNTLMQGMLANEIITALNSNFGHNIELLSDNELLSLVGVSQVPIPAAAWLFGSALLMLVGRKRYKV